MSTSHSNAEYVTIEPSRGLADFVFRYVVGTSHSAGGTSIRIPPTGGIFISYVFGSPLRVRIGGEVFQFPSKMFIGGQLRHRQPILETEGKFGLLGAELSPTGFYRLFHRDASRYTDAVTDLAAALPDFIEHVRRKVSHDASVESVIAAIESYLYLRKTGALETSLIDAVVSEIIEANGIVRIADLASAFNLSSVALRRDFLRAVGVPPKHFAKIVQVNAIISALNSGQTDRLQALAMDHGYFDHAHFVHDFRRIIGLSPTEFLSSGSSFLRTFMGDLAR